jgi:hypothetical protein
MSNVIYLEPRTSSPVALVDIVRRMPSLWPFGENYYKVFEKT